MATDIKMLFCIGLAVVLTGVGKSAFIGKSHSGGRNDPVLQYVVNNSLRENPVLTKLRLRTLEDPWSIMMVSSEQAQFMANLIKLINATKAIEIGMYTGYNALSMALAMPENGRVVACEIEDTYVDIAKPFFKEAGVENIIDVRHQIAMTTLNGLIAAGEAGTYDFVFIDADKFNYDRYYEKSLELIRRGGIIAIDNVLWSGRVVNPAPDDLTSQSLDALNKKLHKDQRIDLSMLTVGDGLTIAIKR
ncbi:catechol O-methyltransferase domain-containing protein 1 [Enoplosus armatus]|uniref:catechol O-methyltransferase domain-containing protein 1 n=1 Tax=Enoplosus armatus TaxID=215367 RepID=UPI0039962BE0